MVMRTLEPSFRGTRAGPGARQAEARSKAMAGQIKAVLDRYLKELVDEEVRLVRAVVKKSIESAEQRAINALVAILQTGGLREVQDAGNRSMGAGQKFIIPPTFQEEFLREKTVLATGLVEQVREEFQRNMGNQIGRWMTEEPGITASELARRIRFSTYLDDAEVLAPGQKPTKVALQPLERGPAIVRNVWGRSSLIARTEMMQAQNQGNLKALEASGVEYIEWSSSLTDGGRGHQELNGDVRRLGDYFTLPDGSEMRWPGDNSRGAGIKHIANCRCTIRRPSRARIRQLKAEGKLV